MSPVRMQSCVLCKRTTHRKTELGWWDPWRRIYEGEPPHSQSDIPREPPPTLSKPVEPMAMIINILARKSPQPKA